VPIVADPISHVNVWPIDDELLVTWRGGSEDVSVFVSDSPVDAGTNVSAPDGPGRVSVERTRRTYIHLFDPDDGFTVAAQRVLPFETVRNFRDIGGYPTMDGAATRWGQVFRSGRLDELTDADHDHLRELGITRVFDLRTQGEVDNEPDRLPDDIAYEHMPMSSSVAIPKGLLERISDGDVTSYTKDDMAAGYLRMLEMFPHYLNTMVAAVAAGEKILFHCTAGKDRTGITAMTMLGIAEVADAHVLDDYEVSAQYQPEGRVEFFTEEIRGMGIDPEPFDLHAMLGSPRPVMKKTLYGLRERWQDHSGYHAHLGLTDDTIAAARANLRFEQPG